MGSLGVLGGADDVADVTMQPNSGKRAATTLDQEIDWERFGLGHEIDTSKKVLNTGDDGGGNDDERYFNGKQPKDNELFNEDQVILDKLFLMI